MHSTSNKEYQPRESIRKMLRDLNLMFRSKEDIAPLEPLYDKALRGLSDAEIGRVAQETLLKHKGHYGLPKPAELIEYVKGPAVHYEGRNNGPIGRWDTWTEIVNGKKYECAYHPSMGNKALNRQQSQDKRRREEAGQ